MRIAVVGAGAIGAYWGAAMQRGGAEVHLIARNAHLQAMRTNGVRVLSDRGDFVAYPTRPTTLATSDRWTTSSSASRRTATRPAGRW